jgi:hypothetical protein
MALHVSCMVENYVGGAEREEGSELKAEMERG